MWVRQNLTLTSRFHQMGHREGVFMLVTGNLDQHINAIAILEPKPYSRFAGS